MPRERLPMRKIGDVLRLHAGGLSKRRIAVSLNIGRTAVGDYISRARPAKRRRHDRVSPPDDRPPEPAWRILAFAPADV